VLVSNQEKLKEVLDSTEFERPCIVKSIYSAGGLMAKTVRDNTKIEDLNINYPCIVQKMIPGRVWSTFSVAHEGKMTYFVSYYPLHTFRENGAAICFKTQYHQGIYDAVKKMIQGTNYSGLIGFDIIEHADGSLWPIECNPRITSGAHMASTVDNFAACVLDSATSLRIVPDDKVVQLSRASMLRILFAPLSTGFGAWFKHFIQAKDVLFDFKDIKPTLGIPLVGILFFHQYVKYKKAAEENIFLNIDWGE
jgi:predicted ATP-grasp superfamily ATP-dependent carboligase